MTEGKLQKKIMAKFKEEFPEFTDRDVLEIVEEAKKEFPEAYEIASTRIYDVHEIKEWFEKWFGNE